MRTSALSRARRRRSSVAPGISALLTLASLTACGDSTGPAGQAARLEALSGPDLAGTVGEPMAGPIQVKVKDGRGSPVAGAEVEFIASPGGLVAEETDGSAEPSRLHSQSVAVTTNHEGVAAAIWTLGERAGEQTATARVENLPPVEYRAVASPGPPAALVVAAGDKQLGVTGAELADPLMVRLRDWYGNGVSGESVTWQLSAGAGSLSTQQSQTDESGEASVGLTLGATVGLRSVTASHGDLDPIDFVVVGLSVVAEDAVGDTFSYGISGDVVLPDVVALGAGWDGDALLVGVKFRDVVTPANAAGPNLMGGDLDFDTDLNPETGVISSVDVRRRGDGETGMGVDAYVDMFARANGNFIVFAFDPNFRFVGQVTPTFRGELVHFAIPSSMLGTDSLTMALVVATAFEATDIAPEVGAVPVRRVGN